MSKKTILIADRDVSFRQDLRKKIESLGYPAVFHEICNGPDAIRYIDCNQPSMMFINASLPGMPGFEVLDRIMFDPITILISDDIEDAARAIDYGVLGYLHRPICTEDLRRTLRRLEGHEKVEALSLLPVSNYPRRIFVEKGGRLIKINIAEITYLRADRDYTWIYTVQNDIYLSSLGIGILNSKLDPNRFMRVHRSFIVNLDHVQELYRDVRRFLLVITGKVEINVGKQYIPLIRALIY